MLRHVVALFYVGVVEVRLIAEAEVCYTRIMGSVEVVRFGKMKIIK